MGTSVMTESRGVIKTSSFLRFDLAWKYYKIFVLAFRSVLNTLLPPFSTQLLCYSDVFFHSDYWLYLNNPFKPTLVFRSPVIVGRDSEFFFFLTILKLSHVKSGFQRSWTISDPGPICHALNYSPRYFLTVRAYCASVTLLLDSCGFETITQLWNKPHSNIWPFHRDKKQINGCQRLSG